MKPLSICLNLFNRLNQANVVYCHWKSNANIEESLAGKTDLDLLVDENDSHVFHNILKELNYKKVISPAYKQVPGIEDYLGFDFSTGELCHLHIHFKLILGEKYVKNYHLPIENYILSNCKPIKNLRIPIAEIELVLLIIRSCLKTSPFVHRIQFILNKRIFPISIMNEYDFLLKGYSDTALKQTAIDSKLPLDAYLVSNFLLKLRFGEILPKDIYYMRKHITRALRQFKIERGILFFLKKFFLTLRHNRILRLFITPSKKYLPQKAPFIAIVGADGSGKTTVVRELYYWLSWKLTTRKVYFGIPKRISIKIISLFVSVVRRFSKIISHKSLKDFCVQITNFISIQRWLIVAKIRQKKYNSAIENLHSGKIVIADRFPLKYFFPMKKPMDGPRIRKECNHDNLDKAKKEEWIYSQIQLPSMVFILKTSFEELRNRKQDTIYEEHRNKAEAVNSISDSEGITVINGDRPMPEVLKELKSKIWDLI